MVRRRTAIGASVASLAVVVVIVAASFAYYYVATESQISTLNAQVSTLEGQVSSLNSRNTQLQSQIATTQCVRTGEGRAFYVRVAGDGTNNSVTGAKIDAIPYTICASGYTDFGNLITAITPSNGTISLPTAAIDAYGVIVSCRGSNYTAGEVFAAPVRVTILTLDIPSGNTSIVYSTSFPTYEQYSSIQVHVVSNSSISGLSVSIAPVPYACVQTPPYCTPVPILCNPPSNSCINVTAESSTATFTFQGVKQGYYWLGFERKLSNNGTTGSIWTIYVADNATYYVTAYHTAMGPPWSISITNSTSK